jgi:hypothetical protein
LYQARRQLWDLVLKPWAAQLAQARGWLQLSTALKLRCPARGIAGSSSPLWAALVAPHSVLQLATGHRTQRCSNRAQPGSWRQTSTTR